MLVCAGFVLVCAERHRNFDFQGGLCWFVLGLCWFVLKSIVSSINEKVCAGLCWFVLVCAGLCILA